MKAFGTVMPADIRYAQLVDIGRAYPLDRNIRHAAEIFRLNYNQIVQDHQK